MRRLIVIFVSICVLPAAVTAKDRLGDRWHFFSRDRFHCQYYYDKESMVYTNELTKVWYKIRCPKKAPFEVYETTVLTEIDCSKRLHHQLQWTGIKQDGSEMLDNEPKVWGEIQPETWIEALYKKVCPILKF